MSSSLNTTLGLVKNGNFQNSSEVKNIYAEQLAYNHLSGPLITSEVVSSVDTGDISARELLGGLIVSSPDGAETINIPSAADIVNELSSPTVGDVINVMWISTTAGNTVTIGNDNAGVNLELGNAEITEDSKLLKIRLDNVNPGDEEVTVYG